MSGKQPSKERHEEGSLAGPGNKQTTAQRKRCLVNGATGANDHSPLFVRGIVKVIRQALPAMNPRPTLPAFHPLRLALFWQWFYDSFSNCLGIGFLTAAPRRSTRMEQEL